MEQRLIGARFRTNEIMNTLITCGFEFDKPYNINASDMPDYIDWAYGATRLVVWDTDNMDYVVKIPLGTDCFKYCEKEVDVYRAAVVEGVDRYFAWTEFIDYYDDYPVYAMEFVDCDCDGIEDSAYTDSYHRWCEENGYDPEDEEISDVFNDMYYSSDMSRESILDWFYNQVSDLVVTTLSRFIRRNRINDLHSANLGFVGDHVCLCDYAGFGW